MRGRAHAARELQSPPAEPGGCAAGLCQGTGDKWELEFFHLSQNKHLIHREG